MVERSATGAGRGRGRPRDLARDAEIREAAWHLVAEAGCAGLTFEAIAARVGCSRSTLYRRFSNKAELISHLLDQTAYDYEPQLQADAAARERLIAHARTCARMYQGDRGAALIQIIAASRTDETIARAVSAHSAMVEPHYYAPMAALAPEASDRSIKLALHGLIGSILHHVATRRDSLSAEEIDRLVDGAIFLAQP